MGPTTGAGPSSSGATSNGVRYTALAALGAVVSATEPALFHSLAPSLLHALISPIVFYLIPAKCLNANTIIPSIASTLDETTMALRP